MPKLEALVAIGQAAAENGWLTVGWPKDDVEPDFSDDEGNAVVVMLDDIRDLGVSSYVRVRCTKLDFDPVRVAIQMLGLATSETEYLNAPNPTFYARHLEQLARARFALIVLTHEIRLPTTEGASTFEAGRVTGAAMLYEIETRELRGAFEYRAENSWQLKGNDRTIDDRLRGDLAARFSAAVIDGIADRFPRGRAPATLGYV